jgi:hypothetical protein
VSGGSRLGPARAALFDQLASWPDLIDHQVAFGLPVELGPRVVAVRGLAAGDEVTELLGPTAAGTERFGIVVQVVVYDPNAGDADCPAIDAAAFELADIVRAAVLANRTLRPSGDPGHVFDATVASTTSAGVVHPFDFPDFDTRPGTDSGRVCGVDLVIACTARAPRGA